MKHFVVKTVVNIVAGLATAVMLFTGLDLTDERPEPPC